MIQPFSSKPLYDLRKRFQFFAQLTDTLQYKSGLERISPLTKISTPSFEIAAALRHCNEYILGEDSDTCINMSSV